MTVKPGIASAAESCQDVPPSVEYSVASVKSYVRILLNFLDAVTTCNVLFGSMTRRLAACIVRVGVVSHLDIGHVILRFSSV